MQYWECNNSVSLSTRLGFQQNVHNKKVSLFLLDFDFDFDLLFLLRLYTYKS